MFKSVLIERITPAVTTVITAVQTGRIQTTKNTLQNHFMCSKQLDLFSFILKYLSKIN